MEANYVICGAMLIVIIFAILTWKDKNEEDK